MDVDKKEVKFICFLEKGGKTMSLTGDYGFTNSKDGTKRPRTVGVLEKLCNYPEPWDYVGDAGQHCFCIDNELGYKCAKKDKGKWKGILTALCNSEDLAAAKANEKVAMALEKGEAMELTEELYQLIKVNICSRDWLFQKGAMNA